MNLILAAFIILSVGPTQNQSAQDTVESPALRALREAARRDTGAVARFRVRLRRAGAPLIEAIPGDSAMRLVTFVWWGADSVRNVAVITPYSLIDIELGRMRRLQGTVLWYRSFHMPTDAVMVYRFGPGDSMLPFMREPDLVRRMAAWLPDSLNSRTFTFADGTRASVLRLGEVPRAAVRKLPLRHGATRIDTVPGHASWPDQRVFIRTPPDFRANSRRPLLVLMDGDAYLQLMHIDSVLDDLNVSLGERAPVVVLVPADPADRSAQYDCNTGWSAYLAGSLVPWIEQRYGTSRDPRDRVLGGYSLGGLAAACAAITHPEVFGNVLAQSGSFYRGASGEEPEALARRISRLPLLPVRWSLSIGQLETSAIPSGDPSMLTATRHLRDVLTAKGYSLHYHEIFGGHEQVAWAVLLPEALNALLQR